jgi:hypothetical protein
MTMPNSYWDRIAESKASRRDELAALPFSEKIEVLERLRARARELSGRSEPFSAAEREISSNLRISSESFERIQPSAGRVQIGMIRANSTLIVAGMRDQPNVKGQEAGLNIDLTP